jgi:hypothetical protein
VNFTLHNSESFSYLPPVGLHFVTVVLRSGASGVTHKERTSEVSVVYVQGNYDRNGCGVGARVRWGR